MSSQRDNMHSEVARLAGEVGASPRNLPGWDSPRGDATPHAELHGSLMSWVVCERGHEYERRTSTGLHEWLSWVFAGVTRWMASEWELQKRIPYVEPRLTMFAKHLELLEKLDMTWAKTHLATYVEVLLERPYKTTDYRPAAVRAATGFLLGAVRMTNVEHDSADIVLATSALIADGLRGNGVGIDEIRRIDRWASRLPAPRG